MDILVTGATIVSMDSHNRILSNGAIAIEKNSIVAVGDAHRIQKDYAASRVIDARGKVIFPGFVNTHTHLFQSLLKGLGSDLSLFEWLKAAIFPASGELTEEECHVGALLGCIEAIKSGTTCINDFMYAHPRPRLSDAIVSAFKEIGIRGILSRGIADSGKDLGYPEWMIQPTEEAIEDCERLLRAYHGSADGRISIWPALASIRNASLLAFKKASEIAKRYSTGITFHASETRSIVNYSMTKYGMTEMELLSTHGLLDSNVLAVHCVWLSDRDIALVRDNAVKVSHCPVSNMYLASGIAPLPKMIREGITVSLGTDGSASNNNQDMIYLLKTTALLHKASTLDPLAVTAKKVLEMATIHGAKALGKQSQIGSIEPGKKADLAILDLRKPYTVPVHDVIANLVYAASPENIDTVIVDGIVLYENHRVTTVDEAEVVKKAQRLANSLIERTGVEIPGHSE